MNEPECPYREWLAGAVAAKTTCKKMIAEHEAAIAHLTRQVAMYDQIIASYHAKLQAQAEAPSQEAS